MHTPRNSIASNSLNPDLATVVNTILEGDCRDVLPCLPPECVDLIFADPPYNLQLRQELWRPNQTLVAGVKDDWDRFASFEAYDQFTREWLSACRRVLKPDGAIWVIGTYHNIYRVGAIMQDLGFWFLNDVVWVKTNPMPNFRGVRLTNAHETLIWAAKSKRSRYTFNHHTAKLFNGGKQLRSDWEIPICTGAERLKVDGRKLHSTQKPEALLERILRICTHPGDVVLDPFLGTGTTAAVAKRLHRRWIGVEKEASYVTAARERIDAVVPELLTLEEMECRRMTPPRVPFRVLVELGLVRPGQVLFYNRDPLRAAVVTNDGQLRYDGTVGSIHQVGRLMAGGAPCNGWKHWFYQRADGSLAPIDELRTCTSDARYKSEDCDFRKRLERECAEEEGTG